MAARLSGAPLPPLFFDEDDDFGEFEFVSAPQPPRPQPTPSYLDYFRTAAPLHPLAPFPNTEGGSGGQGAGGGDDGDEWGDFMESRLSFDTPPPVPPPPSHPQAFTEPASARSEVKAPKASKGWEKPTGAIPLSIFGEEEGDVEEPNLGGGSALPGAKDLFFPSAPKPTKVGPVGVGIQDLLADLYGQAEANKAVANADGEKVSNGTVEGGADDEVGHSDQDDDFDNGGWEFKGAVLDVGLADLMSGQQKDIGDLFSKSDISTNGVLFQNDIISGSFGEHTAESSSTDNSMSPNFVNGHANFNEKKFEVKDNVLGSKDLQKCIDFFGLQDAGPISNGKHQELDDLWGNHMEELSTSTASDMKQESSEDIKPISRGTGSNGLLNKTNFPDLLSSLYEETSKEMEKKSPTNVNGSADAANMDAQLFNDNDWYSQNLYLKNRMLDETSLCTETHQHTQIKSEKQKLLVSFYSDLKQATYPVALHHLENLKKAYEHAVHSGEELKGMKLYQEIQEASAKLQVSPEDIENAAKDNFDGISLGDLLEKLQHPQYQTLDREFSLSERIASAEKEMGIASDLYEHALSTLYILQSASLDGQQRYFMAWSKMLLACLQELQHGANIWTECVHANMCSQILSEHRGCDFLLALGEIYKVSIILQLSLKAFKPWMLLCTTEECDPFDCSDRCSKFWIDSGLHKALEDIPEQMHTKENIKMLLKSIKSIHDLNVQSLQNQMPSPVGPVCQLSLLPLEMQPDMKAVVWDGKSYFLKIANLWANRVSCDPPNLPLLKVG